MLPAFLWLEVYTFAEEVLTLFILIGLFNNKPIIKNNLTFKNLNYEKQGSTILFLFNNIN